MAVGNKLDGKIKKLTQAGVLIEIMAGISGLVFQSDFKHAYPDDSAAPKVGDVVSVTIRDIDVERKRIGLRMRRLQGTKR